MYSRRIADTCVVALAMYALIVFSILTPAQEADNMTGNLVVDASDYLDADSPDFGLQRAIDQLPEGGTLLLPKGTFTIRRSLTLKSNMTLSGVGAETVITIPPIYPVAELAADAPHGATEVKVNDATEFEPGLQVTIRDNRNNTWNETFAIIEEIDGNTIKLDRPLRHNYSVGQNGVVANIFPAILAEDRKNVTIQYLRIVGPDDRPTFTRFVFAAIHVVRCEDVLIARCEVENWHIDAFSVQGGRNVRIMDNVARRNAGHGYHPGTGLQDSFWSFNVGEENGHMGLYYCWDNRHTIVSHNKFIGNHTYGIGRLGDGRDADCLVYRNHVERNGLSGIHSGMWGDCKLNFIVENLALNNCQREPGAGILLQMSRQNVIARNTIVDDQDEPTQIVGLEEMADGTDGNFIVANRITGAQQEYKRPPESERTILADEFPGGIPDERLNKLNELIELDEKNLEWWREFEKNFAPPAL